MAHFGIWPTDRGNDRREMLLYKQPSEPLSTSESGLAA